MYLSLWLQAYLPPQSSVVLHWFFAQRPHFAEVKLAVASGATICAVFQALSWNWKVKAVLPCRKGELSLQVDACVAVVDRWEGGCTCKRCQRGSAN